MGEAVTLGEGVSSGGRAVAVPEHAATMTARIARGIEARVVRADTALGFLKATRPTLSEPAGSDRFT